MSSVYLALKQVQQRQQHSPREVRTKSAKAFSIDPLMPKQRVVIEGDLDALASLQQIRQGIVVDQ